MPISEARLGRPAKSFVFYVKNAAGEEVIPYEGFGLAASQEVLGGTFVYRGEGSAQSPVFVCQDDGLHVRGIHPGSQGTITIFID